MPCIKKRSGRVYIIKYLIEVNSAYDTELTRLSNANLGFHCDFSAKSQDFFDEGDAFYMLPSGQTDGLKLRLCSNLMPYFTTHIS